MIKKLLLSGLILSTGLLVAEETNNTKVEGIDGAIVYSRCAGCHGVNGERSALGKSAIIAAQDSELTKKQIQKYKAGELNQHGMGVLMKGQVNSLTDEEVESVAKYISEMK